MNQAILDKIRKVEPYVPGEQPKERVIKLNTNENPYPPAPGVAKVLKDGCGQSSPVSGSGSRYPSGRTVQVLSCREGADFCRRWLR